MSLGHKDTILDAWSYGCRTRRQHPLVLGRNRFATVEEIDTRAQQVERAGRHTGLSAGQVVGLCAPNGPGFLAGLLGLRRLGCAVALLEWRTPQAERIRVAERLGCAALLIVRQAWPAPDRWQEWQVLTPRRSLPGVPGETAVLKLTSGTSGEAQAVAVSSAALAADDAALARTMGLADRDRILGAIPMSHSYGLGSVALPALLRGSQIVVPEGTHPFAPMQAALALEVSFLPTVPAFLEILTRASRPPRPPSALRLVVTAGAPLRAATAETFRTIYGHAVHVFYGASECGGIAYDRRGGAAERGTLGTPVDGVKLEIVPREGTEEAPSGGRGLVRVTSPAVASGYYPNADPRLGAGSFLTSDVGALEDGELRLHGRIDNVINVRGKKVDPVEVETVLRQLAGVEDVAVVGIPDGTGKGEVVRAVVVRRGETPDAEQLRSFCRPRLAAHKVPRSVIFLPELPRTGRGKLDRHALTALDARRARDTLVPDPAGHSTRGQPA